MNRPEVGEIWRLAHAKVNPFLRVLGRRDDGFHEIETLIVRIELADELVVRPAQARVLRLSGPRAGDVPRDEANLVLRAARALAEAAAETAGAEMLLEKRIPVAAGLGGGSADAAAALRALAHLWGCDPALLPAVAVRVGSDVPALLHEGPVLVRGRGEVVEPVELPHAEWRHVPAAYGISAADAYRWWDEDGGTTGPDPAPLIAALRAGDLEAAGKLMYNDLEPGILRRHPDLLQTKVRLVAEGAFGAVVCGSGPTVVALAEPKGDRGVG